MREYLSKKLIVETLTAHKGQAFTTNELSLITKIKKKTLRSQLRKLVHAGKITRKAIMIPQYNKKRTKKIEQPQVWYYVEVNNGSLEYHGLGDTT